MAYFPKSRIQDGAGNDLTSTLVGSKRSLDINIAQTVLPTGAATETTLSSILGRFPSGLTVTSTRLLVDGSGVTQPISASSLPLPTGAATESTLASLVISQNTAISGLKGNLILGSVTTSAPSYTTGNVNPISMTTSGAIRVDNSAVTQPISVGSLPLPSGAATSALQLLGNASLVSIDGKITTVDTGNVTIISSTLPSGASTSALQSTANTTLGAINTELQSQTTLLNNIATNTSGTASQPAVNGTIAATNGAVTISSIGMQTVVAATTGTWNGTIVLEGQSVSGTWVALPFYTVSTTTPWSLSASFTTNSTVYANCSGYSSVRIRASAWTSGTASGFITAAVGSMGEFAFQAGIWNINNISGTVSLPTGASTAALQTTGNTTLSTIATNTGNIPNNGQTTMVNSLPVVIASNQSTVPVSLASVPTHAVTQSGTWNITNVSGTISLPTGAATETTLSSILGRLPANLTVTATRLLVDGSGVTQPISASSLPLPTGAATESTLAAMSAKLPATLGAKTTANSMAVNIASDQTVSVSVSNFPATQAISASSLPLPTGASTSANQATANTSLSSIDGKLTATANGLKVDGSAVTQPVSIASLPSLASGTNAIGSVSVSNFPSSQAVTVTSLPSIPAGANAIGSVTVSNLPSDQNISGDVAAAATDSGNPVKIGGVYNSTLPTYTTGQRGNIQIDSRGRLISVDGPNEQSYAAAFNGAVTATAATDVFTITGSGTKTIYITKIGILATATASATASISIVKRSSANSGGTSSSVAAVSYDSTNSAATATVVAYTTNPTTLGTTVGSVVTQKLELVVATGQGTSLTPNTPNEFKFGDNNHNTQPLTLRGTSEQLSINLNSGTYAGNSFSIYVHWYEA